MTIHPASQRGYSRHDSAVEPTSQRVLPLPPSLAPVAQPTIRKSAQDHPQKRMGRRALDKPKSARIAVKVVST